MVQMMIRELDLQKDYLQSSQIQTIYFGGGTPSLLSTHELSLLLNAIHKNYTVLPEAEITLEANPDDLSKPILTTLSQQGVNRLSIGIQSFHDPHLRFMNRIHSAQEAEVCVKQAQEVGITNLSIDLMYALPASNHAIWEQDISQALALGVEHISAYCLTIEPKTTFGNWVKKKKIEPIEDEFAAEQFEILMQSLDSQGFEQYEISNFAKNQRYSQHNSAYWQRKPYLGIGPSAHSYNGLSRHYTINRNAAYIQALSEYTIPATVEELSMTEKVNDYLLTGLRTRWGCRLEVLQELSLETYWPRMQKDFESIQKRGWIELENDVLRLTHAGKFFADRVASELFLED